MVQSYRFILVLSTMLFMNTLGNAQHCGNESIELSQFDSDRNASLIKYDIPIVFHIIYSDSNSNISDSIINQGLSSLNEIYNSKNFDSISRNEFEQYLAIPNISFRLSSVNEYGSPSNGINRIKTDVRSFNTGESLFIIDHPKYSNYGGADAWDTDKHLNIWVCNLDPTPQNPNTLLGYAFPPTLANDWDYTSFVSPERQGVVINYRCFLDSQYFNILAHEIGHYLGLKHIWGNSTYSCDNDDGIDDTPLSATPSYTCDFTKNTCNTGADDLPDMVENVMDYSPASCGRYFTYGQVQRMVNNLVYLRPDLYTTEVGEDSVRVLEAFPNPSFGKFTVFLHAKDAPKSTIDIFSLTGELVYSAELNDKKQLIEIPPDKYRHGLYILRLHNKKFCITKKIQFIDR